MRTQTAVFTRMAWVAVFAVLLAGQSAWMVDRVLAADVESLEKALRPGGEALAKVFPELDALAGPMSRDVLDGKADLHAFYGMAMVRMLFEQCQDTIALMRSAQAQECPALGAALVKRLGDAATRLEGAVELVAGALPMTTSRKVGVLGQSVVQALRRYLGPLKEFVGSQEGREL